MEVVLLAHTPNPEEICALAMRSCRSTLPAHKIKLDEQTVKKLVRKAVDSGHFSILEHASFTFSIRGISRSCTHQLVRHRLASFSQQSQRTIYLSRSDINDLFIFPKSFTKPQTEKQYREALERSISAYKNFISRGVPLEDARFILPNAIKTNIVITMNARELLHFFKLRTAKEAQWEIRELANKMLDACREKAPIIFEDISEAETS